jgi:WGR domain
MGSDVEALPAAQRWECAEKRRYYVVCVQRNFFDELEVWRAWGGIGSARGGQRVDPVTDIDAACARVVVIEQRRRVRGYVGRRDVAVDPQRAGDWEVGPPESTPCTSTAPAA